MDRDRTAYTMFAPGLRCSSVVLALGIWAGVGSAQTPPREKQDEILEAARGYSRRYIDSLPSFTCTQTVDQFEGNKKGKHWHKGDTLTSQLVWSRGREKRTLQLVNNRPVSQHPVWRAPLTSEGEFGNLLDTILRPPARAEFTWRGWETLDAKRLAAFDYNIDQQHSPFKLSLGSVETMLPFTGTIYVDEKNGTVWRITSTTEKIPKELKTKTLSRSIDYAEVAIGENRYVLPVRGVVFIDTGSGTIRNELRFESYRKFTADSRISFGADESPGH